MSSPVGNSNITGEDFVLARLMEESGHPKTAGKFVEAKESEADVSRTEEAARAAFNMLLLADVNAHHLRHTLTQEEQKESSELAQFEADAQKHHADLQEVVEEHKEALKNFGQKAEEAHSAAKWANREEKVKKVARVFGNVCKEVGAEVAKEVAKDTAIGFGVPLPGTTAMGALYGLGSGVSDGIKRHQQKNEERREEREATISRAVEEEGRHRAAVTERQDSDARAAMLLAAWETNPDLYWALCEDESYHPPTTNSHDDSE